MAMRPRAWLCGRGREASGENFVTELADRNASTSRLDASVASTTSNSTAETVDPPSAFTETGGGGDDDEGAEVVAAQLPHVKRHFLAAFLHFFAFFRHWSVGHMPAPVFAGNSLLIFFVHLLAFHLSWQAASVRFTHTAAARATSSALRISPEAEPATEWATPK